MIMSIQQYKLQPKRAFHSVFAMVIVSILFIHIPMSAQFYNGSNQSFGKNRVQYNDFLWTYYKFDDLDTYFYLNGKELAQYAARYATEQIPVIEAKMETILDKRIQFIVFNNLTDLKQSNIGLMTDDKYNVGGVTHIIGSKVFLYFDGNHVNFEEQIRTGIAEVLFNQMMFGGTLTQQVKTATFFSLPEWYRIGLISWLGKDWGVELDNVVRDGILSGRYTKLNNLVGKDATFAGHSLWRFIASQYGTAAVSNIIHMTSMSNSIDKGFMYVTGRSFKMIVKEWKEYYDNEFSQFLENTNLPDHLVKARYKSDVVFNRPILSPDGEMLAYTTNEMGKYKVFIKDLKTGKQKKILRKGVMIDTKTDYSYPLLSWHPTGKLLAIVIEDKGMPWLYLYNLEEKHFTRQILYNVQKINDFAYSDDGRLLAVSATQKGQSDIFIFDIAASSWLKITDDIYSDLSPAFINHSSQIVFSSNRENDTLGKEPGLVVDVPDHFDLFVYDRATHNRILKRITNTPLADESQPKAYGINTISYLSDANGITNNYLAVIDSTVSSVDTAIHYRYFTHVKAITDYSRNIIDHQVVPKAGKQAMTIYHENRYQLYVEEALPYDAIPGLKLTDTKYFHGLRASYETDVKGQKHEPSPKLPVELLLNDSIEAKPPPMARPNIKRFVMVYRDADGNEILGIQPAEGGEGLVGSGTLPGLNGPPSGSELVIPKRLNYNVSYFINDLTSQVDFNYINYGYQPFTGGGSPIYLNPGFNVFFQVGLTDLMEDHRFIGGIRLNTSLINNEYLFSYADLSKQLDKEIVFHRNTIENSDGYSLWRVNTHELFYSLKWPFSEALSLKGTLQYRNEMYVFMATDQINLKIPNGYSNWGGLKMELIFDNTRSLGTNLLLGTRYKVFAEYNQLFAAVQDNKVLHFKQKYNLFVIGADFRHYTKIHRTFIWANRLAASTSFGASPLIYYMGGVDNWLLPVFNTNTPIDYNQNYAYQTLATNMRGFNQNIRNGNSFVVINTELRFPVFQYFSRTPISSGFLRSFQLVGFGDIGTAWTGLNPYSRQNALYTNYIDSGPMHISVEVQKEPIVAGFGLGARTTVFGYFVRGDVSWGVDDYQVTRPVYYLSLSLDF